MENWLLLPRALVFKMVFKMIFFRLILHLSAFVLSRETGDSSTAVTLTPPPPSLSVSLGGEEM